MTFSINPPPLQVPAEFATDKVKGAFFGGLVQTIYQLWTAVYAASVSFKAKTTDATYTGALRIPVKSGTSIMITAEIIGRRSGGAAGAEGDTAWYQLSGAYKNINGVVTGVGTPNLIGGEDQPAWNVGFSNTGEDVVIGVLGVADNNITWQGSARTVTVGV